MATRSNGSAIAIGKNPLHRMAGKPIHRARCHPSIIVAEQVSYGALEVWPTN